VFSRVDRLIMVAGRGRDLQPDTHQLSELIIAMQETITAEGVDLIEHGDSCQMMLCAFPNSRQSS
jgi:hypothetical protein